MNFAFLLRTNAYILTLTAHEHTTHTQQNAHTRRHLACLEKKQKTKNI
jgi:hypothetical protein